MPSYAEYATLGFKNHYGSYQITHDPAQVPSYLRDISCTGPVVKKNVLSVCSGIFGMNIGNGPTGSPDNFSVYAKTMDSSSAKNCAPTTIIMSTDPVSAEAKALRMMRINIGKPYDVDSMPQYLRASGGITGVLTPTFNIGVIDELNMTQRTIINDATAVLGSAQPATPEYARLTASSLKGQNSTYIEFMLPSGHQAREASIDIVDLKGALVRRLPLRVLGAVNHLAWDERDAAGGLVKGGMYIVRLVSGTANLTAELPIVR